MPLVLAGILVIGWFVWANWGRGKASAELNRKLDPVWSRITKPKKCKWKAAASGGTGLREFTCQTCGVTAYSASQAGPIECKKGLTGGL